jgi:phage terminase large subunit-like protein
MTVNAGTLRDFTALADRITKLASENKVRDFVPYQTQLNYMNDLRSIKVMFGGNRAGKTTVGSVETVFHLTGVYPSWYKGIRYTKPVVLWVAGVSSVRVRDTLQEKLFGPIGQIGTGMIPASAIDMDKVVKKSGVPQAIDIAMVKHITGGWSSVQFFSYDQGVDKFQGSSVQDCWFDEEPPQDIFNECKMRVLDNKGHIRFTFTPLGGVTELYDNLMQNPKIGKHFLTMDEATHLDTDMINELLEGMDESERKARREGVATVGTKLLFQFPEEDYVCEDFEPSDNWRVIGGLDVGIAHPTGAIKMYIDDVADCVYVTKEYEANGKTALDHKHVLKPWNITFALDRSAWNRQIGTGESTASIYEDLDESGNAKGLKLIKANADAGSVDASIHAIRAAIKSGRFWVFKSCHKLIKQIRLYRTKDDGKTIYKVNDDLCLSGDNRVLTKQFGWVAIDGLVGKEFDIMTPIGWCRGWNVHSKGVKECVTTTLNGGGVFTHTPDHRFLIENKGFSIADIDPTRYIISREIVNGTYPRYANTNGLQRSKILPVGSILYRSDDCGREHQEMPAPSGRVGIPQWPDTHSVKVGSPRRREQGEQLNLKPEIDGCFRASISAHDDCKKVLGKTEHAHSCSCCGERLASVEGGKGEGKRSRNEAGWLGRLYSNSISCLRGMREDLRVSLSDKKDGDIENEVLRAELQDDCVQKEEEGTDECSRCCDCNQERVYVLRQRVSDQQAGYGQVLQTNLYAEGVKSTEDAGSRLVYDLHVDVAHCFFLEAGVVASNCDPMRYAYMARDKAEVPGKPRVVWEVDSEDWQPADKVSGY